MVNIVYSSLSSLDQPLLEQQNGGDTGVGNDSSDISSLRNESELVEDSIEADVASNPESLIETKEFLEFVDVNIGDPVVNNGEDSSQTVEKVETTQERESQANQSVSDPESEPEIDSESPIVPRRSARSNKGKPPKKYGHAITPIVWV